MLGIPLQLRVVIENIGDSLCGPSYEWETTDRCGNYQPPFGVGALYCCLCDVLNGTFYPTLTDYIGSGEGELYVNTCWYHMSLPALPLCYDCDDPAHSNCDDPITSLDLWVRITCHPDEDVLSIAVGVYQDSPNAPVHHVTDCVNLGVLQKQFQGPFPPADDDCDIEMPDPVPDYGPHVGFVTHLCRTLTNGLVLEFPDADEGSATFGCLPIGWATGSRVKYTIQWMPAS